MALLGAEVLFYPTAIGSEPPDPSWDSSGHWQRVMQGHAGANLMPLVAANRIGREVGRGRRREITFYGSSFIADATGAKVAEAGRDGEAVLRRHVRPRRAAPTRASRGACSATAAPISTAAVTLDGAAAEASRRARDGPLRPIGPVSSAAAVGDPGRRRACAWRECRPSASRTSAR